MTDSNNDAWLDDNDPGADMAPDEATSPGPGPGMPSSIRRLKVKKSGGGDERFKQLKVNLGVAAGLVVVLAIGVYIYKAFTGPSDVVVAENSAVPLLEADDTPTKVPPEEPGGMNIPDQDKTVYEVIDQQQGEGEEAVERLMPPPEEPAETADSTPAIPPEPVVTTTSEPAVTTPEPTVIEQPTQTAAETPAPTPEPVPSITLTPDQAWLVQLASFRSSANADAGWIKLSGQAAGLLNGLEPDVARVDLGSDKGIYYRLRAGPLPSKASARELCSKLKAHGLSCLVVKS